ncbi:putative WRKY transcription factor 53 [Apostasia shenzhenica]|uniref:Putative WRKY transcription factor 53 n=1 Tax=Apostasia shenzhenica TaxID=1088818 RepID=A0A2I0B903_9ASPA|nr:putative WRKY transcription factor 53 [Apostasia shenzhenica]
MEGSAATVIAELTQLHELARKLGDHLDPCQIELCRSIAQEIVCSVEKAIRQAKSSAAGGAESLFSKNRALETDELDLLLNDNELQMPKKRKMLPKWTSRASSITGGGEGLPDDGHSWRKYGQKDILGARFPRLVSKDQPLLPALVNISFLNCLKLYDEMIDDKLKAFSNSLDISSYRAYYRCTHRKTQGCPAMKQIQRSDENHSVFDIIYRGTHTCSPVSQQNAQRSRHQYPSLGLLDQQKSWQLQFDLKNCLKVKTESSDSSENPDPTSSFSFTSTPTQGMKNDADLFSSLNPECDYVDSLSSALMLPTNSGPNCFPWSPCEMSSHGEIDHDIPFDTSIFFA